MDILQYKHKQKLMHIATNVSSIDEAYDLAYTTEDMLLQRVIYSAMDETEAYAKEKGTHMSEQLDHYIITVKSIIDCVQDFYGYDFVKLAVLHPKSIFNSK